MNGIKCLLGKESESCIHRLQGKERLVSTTRDVYLSSAVCETEDDVCHWVTVPSVLRDAGQPAAGIVFAHAEPLAVRIDGPNVLTARAYERIPETLLHRERGRWRRGEAAFVEHGWFGSAACRESRRRHRCRGKHRKAPC